MQVITVNKSIHGANFFEKLICLSEIVGILLTIKKPIKLILNKFKYGCCRIDKSYWKKINNGSRLNPAAAGEGTPIKYLLESIGLDVK